MKILITGGAGFIGSNLVKRLEQRSHEIRVLDNLSTGFLGNLDGTQAEVIIGSILDIDVLERAASDCSAIVHLAALPSVPRSIKDPFSTNEVNVLGTLNVCFTAKTIGAHLILASSSSVYGANPTLPRHEALIPMPMSPYAVSKLAAEQYALAFAESYGLRALPFRFFNVYGPGQDPDSPYSAVVPKFLKSAISQKPLHIHGDGEQSRDFTFVDDLTLIIADAIEKQVASKSPVNLSFGDRKSVNEVVSHIQELHGSLSVEYHPVRTGDVQHSQSDGKLLRQLFPDQTITPFVEGLAQTYRSMLHF